MNEIDMQIEQVFNLAKSQNASVIAVKDLPCGHFLEGSLIKREFIPIEHDPIWYCKVPTSLDGYIKTLSKGRSRGLKNRWNRFQKFVQVREATKDDISFIMTAYNYTWQKSVLKLEKLTIDFYMAALLNQQCKIFIYEHDNTPFAFTLLYLKDRIIFDKYIGIIPAIGHKFSLYSMSILYLLDWAHKEGFQWYIAGQGGGKSKRSLGFSVIPCKIWAKPLKFTRVLMFFANRIINIHSNRITSI
ncbi:GNAT family N-acetyltransferase [Legionella steigerwaltii]|nr:GNAT family N-acetyltransferase [Legionella steigerwaltii]